MARLALKLMTQRNSTRTGVPIKPKRERPPRINSIFDIRDIDYRDTREFKAYMRKVNSIIQSAGRPVTVREIRAEFGEGECHQWTADALYLLNDQTIKAEGVLLVKYSPFKPEPRRVAEIDTRKQNEWLAHQRNLSKTYPTAAIGAIL